MDQQGGTSTAATATCKADDNESVQCLAEAVRLGHLEVARELLLSGLRLAWPLHKEDFEAAKSSEIERDLDRPVAVGSAWRDEHLPAWLFHARCVAAVCTTR